MIELLAQTTVESANDAALAWGVVLLAIAIILLFLELLLPSGGLLSITAAVAVIGSLVAFFTYSPQTGFIVLGLYVVLGPVVLWLGFKWWVSSPLGRRMILGAEDDPLDRTPDEAFAASNAARRSRSLTSRSCFASNSFRQRRMPDMSGADGSATFSASCVPHACNCVIWLSCGRESGTWTPR